MIRWNDFERRELMCFLDRQNFPAETRSRLTRNVLSEPNSISQITVFIWHRITAAHSANDCIEVSYKCFRIHHTSICREIEKSITISNFPCITNRIDKEALVKVDVLKPDRGTGATKNGC